MAERDLQYRLVDERKAERDFACMDTLSFCSASNAIQP
jgi:hypothetical protein